jgi:IS5 family transposase
MKQPGFFDVQQRHQWLEGKDPLVELARCIPWEEFRPLVEQVQRQDRKSAAGRPAWDAVLIMKALVLRTLYNLSDDQLEYQIRDRLSFMRFLGLQLEDRVPDAKTLWLYRERLRQHGLIEQLLGRFEAYLQHQGYQARKGQIVDATIVPVPRQRNTREENQQIKTGEVPPSWSDEPAKLAQKDCDARWTMKEGRAYYGYKNHVCVDVQHRFIRHYEVSAANVHDGRHFEGLLQQAQRNQPVYADGAYRSIERIEGLKAEGFIDRLQYRGHKHQGLSEAQKRRNRRYARTRIRIEHVFGFQHNSMGGKFLRCIGMVRAHFGIGMMNLVYNFMRLVQLQRISAVAR